jgi:hypothetical protein
MSGVEPRWTVYDCGGPCAPHSVREIARRPLKEAPPVPVVPCDEAAVERAQYAISQRPANASPQELAIVALRAAGAVEQ